MTGTTSWIISNLVSSLEQLLSQFMPTISSLAASSSSSIAQEDVTAAEVNSIQKRSMEDLSRLSRMLPRIQAALHDAEEREIDEKAIQLWLSELREVAYDADNVLDQYDYQVIKTQLEEMKSAAQADLSLKRKQVDDDDSYGYQDWKIDWALEALQDSDDNFWKEALMDGRFIHEIKRGYLDEEIVGMSPDQWPRHEIFWARIGRRSFGLCMHYILNTNAATFRIWKMK